MTIGPDRTLLHYRLLEKIGAGAMGDVWKALDTDLEREVAIKVLPAALAEDDARLSRFRREARLMAALQHPNVAAVYGVHEAEGIHFLAMEYVPGEDLADRLARGPLAIPETIQVACGITRGLEAAHANGVIHRDLKPANVRILPDGSVKVLDFGLAKAVGDEARLEQTATQPGVVLGTAPYMSPEQVRGQPLDQRSDIWAFGCVLFECLVGASPFRRESTPEALGAILHDEPDLDRVPANAPATVRRVLSRCLVKDPDARLHHIADARIELEAAEEVAATTGTSASRAEGGGDRRALLALGLLAAALAAALVVSLLSDGEGRASSSVDPLAGATIRKLTAFPGVEFDAAISPDGKWVAFLSDHEGAFAAYVGLIGSGEYVDLTEGWVFDDVRAEIRKVGFVGDGEEVWLSWMLRQEDEAIPPEERRMKAAPLQGGSLRNILDPLVVNADWSQEHGQIAYHLASDGDPVFVVDARGSDPVEVPLHTYPGHHQHHPTWSPDGAWIYLVRGRPATGEMQLWRCRPDGADPQQLTHDKLGVMYPAPLDDHTVLYVAREADGSGPWLWALDLRSGASRRATRGVELYTSISASADGRRLVATVSNPRASLWSVPIGDGQATEADVAPFPLSRPRALSPRIRGEAVFFLSSEGSADGLWRHQGGEARELWRGIDGALRQPAAISPDGRRVAFVLQEGRRRRLHVMGADGTGLRALSEALDVRGAVDFSHDGTEVVAGGEVGGNAGLFILPLDGGRPRRIASGEALNPVWSPRDDLIVYGGRQIQGLVRLHAVTSQGEELEFPDIRVLRYGERFRFLPDGSGLVYMRPVAAQQDFWLLDLDTMTPRRLTQLDSSATMRTFDITADGSRILFDRVSEDSDIVLIELPDETRLGE